jgi:hypothetical protein
LNSLQTGYCYSSSYQGLSCECNRTKASEIRRILPISCHQQQKTSSPSSSTDHSNRVLRSSPTKGPSKLQTGLALAQLRPRCSHNCQQYDESESSFYISRDRDKITIIRTPLFSIRIYTQSRLRRDRPISAVVPCPRIRSHWRILETGRISSHMALQSSISRVFLRGFLDTQCSG